MPLSILGICSCFWHSAPAKSENGAATAKSALSRSDLHRIVGNVTLDGKPVRYFGITATRTPLIFHPTPPTVINAVDGRFSIDVQAGQWSIIVAGPGFARYIVPNVVTRSGYVNPPLQIVVDRGYRIDGRVTDISSNPIGGAIVRILQSANTPNGDTLWELSRGNYSTLTESDGSFRFDGVSAINGRAQISASLMPNHGVSLPQEITNSDASLDLVLLPVGSIEGVLTGAPARDTIVVARSVAHRKSLLSVGVEGNGTFRFNNVPVGEYDVGVLMISGSRGATLIKRLSVVAWQPVIVTLVVP